MKGYNRASKLVVQEPTLSLDSMLHIPLCETQPLPIPNVVWPDVATSLVVQGLTARYLTSVANADLIKPGE